MTDLETLEQRLVAIERTVLEDDHERRAFEGDSAADADLEGIETRLDALEARVAELEATVQSIDGYVSQVESVNQAVERRADAALATVDRLESRLEALESTGDGQPRGDESQSSAGHAQNDKATNRPADAPAPVRQDRERSNPTDDGQAPDEHTDWPGPLTKFRDVFAGVREWIP
ncbi:hypothetical protein HLRTI_001010 [Halorhabdus tiamatea SARL4B]|uniref:DUF7310 domain-containing protein n=1 Tax=Halorhabdus tiamatea SARL4B TaxID=1033806 RepID=F7PHT8_9EURY|nr:hypothetical protein [Halorhabdus tiamatea]ERJ06932.1 hypothetical protein HLRTI_001010 [Halorhabdus tiamatea SARL4B]CCQ32366.1 hypothetical protein (DUF745) [Halorhabdus tiamatea SARL4B]